MTVDAQLKARYKRVASALERASLWRRFMKRGRWKNEALRIIAKRQI